MQQLAAKFDPSNLGRCLGIAGATFGLFCAFHAAPLASAPAADVSPPVRYQLLSVAVVAGDTCPRIDQRVSALATTQRDKLAEALLSSGGLTQADLADIRRRAQQLFQLYGCQSAAIRELIATVRQVEGGRSD